MASKSRAANMQDGEGENSRMYGIDDGMVVFALMLQPVVCTDRQATLSDQSTSTE